MNTGTVVVAQGLSRHYEVKSHLFSPPRITQALKEANFRLQAGKTIAVVGESGCGKSTLAWLVTMIEEPTGGALEIKGEPATPESWGRLRDSVQIVFQDPYCSLNPRQRIGSILEEPLKINCPELFASEWTQQAWEMRQLMDLQPEQFKRYPHMFLVG